MLRRGRDEFAKAAAAVAPALTLAATIHHHPERHCARTFTLRMDERAAHAVYRGARHVTHRNLRMLGYIERCQRRLGDWPLARQLNRRLDRAHRITLERARLARTLTYATASWYEDAGSTASGFHATYGVAVCGSGGGPCVAFGTRILFHYHGRQVIAVADDHGPYVAGRAFDLGQSTAAALGFAGVDTVGYRILG